MQTGHMAYWHEAMNSFTLLPLPFLRIGHTQVSFMAESIIYLSQNFAKDFLNVC